MVVVDSAEFDKKRKIAEGFRCYLHFLHAWKEHKLLSYGWSGLEDLHCRETS